MLNQFVKIAVPLVALSLLAFGLVHITSAQKPEIEVEPPSYPPQNPFKKTIAGSGIVEPQSENISIGATLPGVVVEVFVSPDDAGELVSQGDPLFRVDDRHLQAQLIAQEASLAVPKAEMQKQKSLPRPEEIPPARHRVEAAQANLKRATDDYERLNRLASTAAITQSELVDARENKEFAVAELSRAESELQLLLAGAWEPDLAITQANIARIEAQIAQTKTEIERSLVRAPVDGKLLQVNVRPGEFVATPAAKDLLVIGDMRKPRVRVDIDETDIPRFQESGRAQAFLRGGNAKPISLKFLRVEPYVIPKRSLTGANTERVDTRVMQVLYEIEEDAGQVLVGQQLDVFVECEESAIANPR
ncbi:MAG: HlyD family efflux transporter periplasmic adaptor subunit [Pirellulaceae bacterium]